jgi:Heterokaryon incompatibility protein (HET)
MPPSLDRLAAYFKRKQVDTYRYLPLNEEASQIRLLTLLPGKFSAKIHIRFDIKQLTIDDCPSYEALSYVWGPTQDLVDIFIGSSTRYTLAITQNLARALPYLRYADKERVLWIDAICINQNDLKERGQQVKRMASIYKMARRVVVWLGEEEDNSTMALRTLEMLSTKISPPHMRKAIKPTSTPGSEAHWAGPTAHLPFNDLEWTSINDLFDRAWFERLWIWQEIRMENRDAIILCGFSTIRWEAFYNGVLCLCRKTFPIDLPKYWRRRSNIYHLGSNQGHRPFTELVRQTRFSKCSDPKDRVYALFSMAPVEEGIIIEPDYTKSVHEVYTELFMNRLEHTKSLRLLRFCELRQPCQGMPTWVPDWSCPSISDRLPDYLASGISTTDAYVARKATLRVKGLHLTTIKHVEVFPLLDDSTMVKIGGELLRLASCFNLQSSSMEKGGCLELFWRTINGNMFSDCFYPPAHSFPNFQRGIKALYDGLAGNAVNLEFRPHLLFGRSVFETYDGYIGLAPKGTKENDFGLAAI